MIREFQALQLIILVVVFKYISKSRNMIMPLFHLLYFHVSNSFSLLPSALVLSFIERRGLGAFYCRVKGGRGKQYALQWRHNGRDSVSNHGCLLHRLFRRRSKKTLKLRVTPAQMANDEENVSIWWRHYGVGGPHLCWCIVAHDDVIKWKRFPRYWPFVRGFTGPR